MRFLIPATFLLAMSALGQPPQQARPESFVDRMMAFDKNHDGKLTRDEITDDRLLRIFDRADVDKDGFVTKQELEALFAKEAATFQDRPRGGPGQGGPGGGRGGRGGFGPPQAGQIIPGFMQDRLNLSADQKKQIDALQKEVDAKLDAILSADQKQQLKQGPGDHTGPPRDPR